MSNIKSGEELYHYCKANLHTKRWIQELENEQIRAMNYWLENFSPVGRNGYYLKKLERNYLTPIDNLALLLENRCREEITFDTVYYAANRVFKDIARQLEQLIFSLPYYVIFCANKRKETIFFVGPQTLPKEILWGETGIFMTLGYDVLVDFIDRANYSTLSELIEYLESKGYGPFRN